MQVGGRARKCPLCQNPLTGDGTPDYFPGARVRGQSLVCKILSFVILSLGAALILGNQLILPVPYFRELCLVLLLAGTALFCTLYIGNHRPGIVRLLFFLLIVILFVTALIDRMYGMGGISVRVIFPLLLCGVLITNFVFSLINAVFTENALFYLLVNILIGIMPFAVLMSLKHLLPVCWALAMIVSVITLIGTLIFKWQSFLTELQKRFHM